MKQPLSHSRSMVVAVAAAEASSAPPGSSDLDCWEGKRGTRSNCGHVTGWDVPYAPKNFVPRETTPLPSHATPLAS